VPGLEPEDGPGIQKTWIAGSSPAKTDESGECVAALDCIRRIPVNTNLWTCLRREQDAIPVAE
jgi:hypothetical protein